MPSIDSFTAAGAKSASKVVLDKNVFGLKVNNHELLKSAYTAYLANGRVNLAKTKTRGEVSGSTRKPWKQKGTGRARFGSKYNPIWRGGGIAFGPTGEENYSKKLPLIMKRLAIKQALSLAAKSGKLKVVEDFASKDGKTKPAVAFLKKIGANGRTLIVISDKNALISRSTANLPDLKVVQTKYLNTYDILNADNIVLAKKSLSDISQWLASEVKPALKSKAEEAK